MKEESKAICKLRSRFAETPERSILRQVFWGGSGRRPTKPGFGLLFGRSGRCHDWSEVRGQISIVVEIIVKVCLSLRFRPICGGT